MSYLYEMHAHVSEVSTCSPTKAKDFIALYKNTEYAGIVLTDHMNSDTFTQRGLGDAPWDKKIDHFLTGYKAVKEAAGDELAVIMAMEIHFYDNPNDYLVYGITEEFLRSHGDLMAMGAKKFSQLAHENGILFLQAHPFRRNSLVTDWKILDGYEIFNGNPRHYSCNPMAEQWAKYHNKSIVTSGSDFHEPEDAGHGGVYFEKKITTPQELVEELKSGNYTLKKDKFKHTRPE
ncbi:MAG: PHP domain-containing protein [Clostridia bacterium]|nr:PHP domain-containing protein [Clostridia bacterium]